MTGSEKTVRMPFEAVNLEKLEAEKTVTIGEVFFSLFLHPLQLISRWNWKAALLGAIMRASFYLTVYRVSRESWLVTLTAVTVEIAFRFFTSGISGSVMQSFRRARPQWLSTLIVSTTLPVFGHLVEYITHFAQEHYFRDVFAASENNARQKAFAISVLMSILSALFNLFAMRDGVLLVGAGDEQKSFWGDLKRLPIISVEFVAFLPLQILRSLAAGEILTAASIFGGFGLTIGFILGIFRGDWMWAWVSALASWSLLLLAIFLTAIIKRARDQRKRTSEAFFLSTPPNLVLEEIE